MRTKEVSTHIVEEVKTEVIFGVNYEDGEKIAKMCEIGCTKKDIDTLIENGTITPLDTTIPKEKKPLRDAKRFVLKETRWLLGEGDQAVHKKVSYSGGFWAHTLPKNTMSEELENKLNSELEKATSTMSNSQRYISALKNKKPNIIVNENTVKVNNNIDIKVSDTTDGVKTQIIAKDQLVANVFVNFNDWYSLKSTLNHNLEIIERYAPKQNRVA